MICIPIWADHGGDPMQVPTMEGSLARDGSNRGKRSRHGRNRHGGSSRSPPPRGESLAGLPITGPGLDLAAELGRAENKDILEDDTVDVSGPPREKRGKKGKVSAADPGMERTDSVNEVDSCESRSNLSKMQTRLSLSMPPRLSTGLSPRKVSSMSWPLIMKQSLPQRRLRRGFSGHVRRG